jgi:endonuclease YncB( thermonuclease family)
MNRRATWLTCGLWIFCAFVFAQDAFLPNADNAAPEAVTPRWTGWVSWVADGDTLLVLPNGSHEAVKLRIQGIDAPERCQPGGDASRDALIDLVNRKTVQVTAHGTDIYGRLLGRVEIDGQDVGAAMVTSGLAWAYSFRVSAGPYASLERLARQQKKGLFAQAQPMTPKVFRQFHGRCQQSNALKSPTEH